MELAARIKLAARIELAANVRMGWDGISNALFSAGEEGSYVNVLWQAMKMWKQFEAECGSDLLWCGVLWFGLVGLVWFGLVWFGLVVFGDVVFGDVVFGVGVVWFTVKAVVWKCGNRWRGGWHGVSVDVGGGFLLWITTCDVVWFSITQLVWCDLLWKCGNRRRGEAGVSVDVGGGLLLWCGVLCVCYGVWCVMVWFTFTQFTIGDMVLAGGMVWFTGSVEIDGGEERLVCQWMWEVVIWGKNWLLPTWEEPDHYFRRRWASWLRQQTTQPGVWASTEKPWNWFRNWEIQGTSSFG